tara:strand:+ start:1833 stop:2582 length:750 start_codon:yes stop_codon:yes gene_type:complete
LKIILALLVGVACLILIGPAYFWVYQIENESITSLDKNQWLALADFLGNMLAPSFAFLSLIALTMTLVVQHKQVWQARNSISAGTLITLVNKLEDEVVDLLKGFEIESDSFLKATAYDLLISRQYINWENDIVPFGSDIINFESMEENVSYKHRLWWTCVEAGFIFEHLARTIDNYEYLTGDLSLRNYYSNKYIVAYERLEKMDFVEFCIENPYWDRVIKFRMPRKSALNRACSRVISFFKNDNKDKDL